MVYKRLMALILSLLIIATNAFTSAFKVFADSYLIGSADAKSNTVSADLEPVSNTAPTAGLSFAPKKKVDLIVNIGKTNHDEGLIASRLNNAVVPALQAKNIDVQATIKKEMYSGYGKIFVNNGNRAVLMPDGSVFMWGENRTGQLGLGFSGEVPRSSPQVVFSDCVDISLGKDRWGYIVALKKDGTVWRWGRETTSPVQMSGLESIDIVDVESGGNSPSIFVIDSSGNVYSAFNPTQVIINNAVKVSIGDYHSLALKNDGTVWAWGNNLYGQLGDGTTEQKPPSSPVQVVGLSDVIDIAAGEGFSLALKSDGTVWSWGDNSNFKLGYINDGPQLLPRQIPGLSNITSIKTGYNFSVALHRNGTVYRWGYYTGSTISVISELSGIVQIAAGADNNIGAIAYDGKVYECGSYQVETYPELYGIDPSPYNNFRVVNYFPAKFVKFIGELSLQSLRIALADDGTVWQLNFETRKLHKVPGLDNVVDIFGLNTESFFALKKDGSMWAWGNNANGQLADGTKIHRSEPVLVTAIEDLRLISGYVGGYAAVGIKKNGDVVAWGRYLLSGEEILELGFSFPNAVKIVSGWYHTLVLLDNGDVYAWGGNFCGQIGDGTTDRADYPKKVFSDAIDIHAGGEGSIAIKSNGAVYKWGRSRYYKWGTLSSLEPEYVPGTENLKPFACINNHEQSWIVTDNGVYYWNNINVSPYYNDEAYIGYRGTVQYDGNQLLSRDGALSYVTACHTTDNPFIAYQETYKSINSIIENTTWREGSATFFINIHDPDLYNLLDQSDLSGLIEKFLNKNISFVSLGTLNNEDQSNEFINSINGNGIFIDNTDLDSALDGLCGYIAESFYPKADIYINIGDTAHNDIGFVQNLADNRLVPALKDCRVNVRVFVNDGRDLQVTEVLDSIPWRSEAERFFVNIHDLNLAETEHLAEILESREIYYCGFGTAGNEQQISELVSRIEDRGLYFDNTDLSGSMDRLAGFIGSRINTTDAGAFVIVGEEITYHAFYSDTELDPRHRSRWKYIHDPYWFDNPCGILPDSGQYRDFPYNSFYMPGKYTVSFQAMDNPKSGAAFDEYRLWSDDTEFRTVIFVHRKPVAQFGITLAYDESNGCYIPSITDTSYDPDHTSRADKGIVKRFWQWKEIEDNLWKDGLPVSLEADKEYLVKLVVTDMENSRSDPAINTVSTGPGNNPPVARFVISPNPVKINQRAIIIDNSFDPDGHDIVERVWTLVKESVVEYAGSEAPVDFSPWGPGDYELKLKVRDSLGAWSEEYTESFSVISDRLPPVIEIEPAERDWANVGVTVKVTATDTDSGISEVRYCWSKTAEKPSMVWEITHNESFEVIQSEHGAWYFHVEAFDGSIMKNASYIVAGPYKIDTIPPVATVSIDPPGWTNTDVVINVSAADEGSGVGSILLPDNTCAVGDTAHYSVAANGKYTFVVGDNTGNLTEIPVYITNIDKLVPSGVFTPNNTSWTADGVSVVFDPHDEGESGVLKWRYRLSNDAGESWGSWSDYIEGDTSREISLALEGIWKIQAEIFDNAGNSALVGSGLYYIDKTAPSGVFIPKYSEWTTENVSVIFDPADTGGSGIGRWRYRTSPDGGSTWSEWSEYISGDTSGSINITAQGTWLIQAEVTDNAGNRSIVSSGVYRIDREKPSGIFTPNNHGWTNNCITVVFEPSDTGGSGLQSWRSRITSDGGNTWSPWSAYVDGDSGGAFEFDSDGIWAIQTEVLDNAGNRALVSSGYYYIDKTKPSGEFRPGSRDWSRDSAEVVFDPDDKGGSGVYRWRYRVSSDNGVSWGEWSPYIAGDTAVAISLSETGIWRVQADIYDNAGNSAVFTSGSYLIDKVPPSASFTPNESNWTNKGIMVAAEPSDRGGSGVYRWRYRTSEDSGGTWSEWSDYINGGITRYVHLNKQGLWMIQAEVEDKAANVETVLSGIYKIDFTPPSVTFSPDGCEWTNRDVDVAMAVTDDGSGTDCFRYRLSQDNGMTWSSWSDFIYSETGTVSIAGGGIWIIQAEVVDRSGNIACINSKPYFIDRENPAGEFDPDGCNWTNTVLNVVFKPVDSGGSGVKMWRYRSSFTDGITWENWSAYFPGAQERSIAVDREGTWRIEVEIIDNAGNGTVISSKKYLIDMTPPHGRFEPDGCGWTKEDISVTFTPFDYGGSGVYRWRYRTSADDGETWNAFSQYFYSSNDYTTEFTENGRWKIQIEVEDNAGNRSVITSSTFCIDKSPPFIDCLPVSRDWANTAVHVQITAGDAESCIPVLKYCRSSSPDKPKEGWMPFGDYVFFVTQEDTGEFYLHMEAVDAAGNSTYKCRGPFRVDRVLPVLNCSPETLESGKSPITVNINAWDAHSGLKYVEYLWSTSPEKPASGWERVLQGNFETSVTERNTVYYLHIVAADNAGNTLYRCLGPYRIVLEAYDFTITSILDIAWRGFYFDLENPVKISGEIRGYPKREGTDIKTGSLPVNSASLIPYHVKSVKAGYKIKGYIKVEGEPESVSFTANYYSGGSRKAKTIPTVKSGITYAFEWIIPEDTDDGTYITFDLTAVRDGKSCGNEIWTDRWSEGNSDRKVLYIKGNALEDLQYIQSH